MISTYETQFTQSNMQRTYEATWKEICLWVQVQLTNVM